MLSNLTTHLGDDVVVVHVEGCGFVVGFKAISSTSASETAGLSSPDTQREYSFATYLPGMSLPNSLVP